MTLPNGGYAVVTIDCDDVLRTLDVTTRYEGADASNAYYMLWGYATRQAVPAS